MKIALLSDIHGNYVALKECLNYIENNNFDMLIFLGDYIMDCPYPQKTLALLKEVSLKYKTHFIRGNKEEYMLDYEKNIQNWTYNSQTGNFLYNFENLTKENLEFFSKMPISDKIEIAGTKPFVICHGSLNKTRGQLKADDDDTNKVLENIDCDYLFCGHTHEAFTYNYKGKILVNCGSVGMPNNNQTKSQFVEIEFINDDWQINLVSVDYNIDKIVEAFAESGVYEKYHYWAKSCVKCLKTGIDYPLFALIRA